MKELIVFMVDVAVEIWLSFDRGNMGDEEIAELAANRVKLEVQRKLASARFDAKLKQKSLKQKGE